MHRFGVTVQAGILMMFGGAAMEGGPRVLGETGLYEVGILPEQTDGVVHKPGVVADQNSLFYLGLCD